MMPIRIKFFLAFSVLVGLACALAFFGIRGIAASGDLVLRLNDGPLTGINHARLAQAKLNEARLLIAANPGNDVRVETELKFGAIGGGGRTISRLVASGIRISQRASRRPRNATGRVPHQAKEQ